MENKSREGGAGKDEKARFALRKSLNCHRIQLLQATFLTLRHPAEQSYYYYYYYYYVNKE
jgi:hypothetical protein